MTRQPLTFDQATRIVSDFEYLAGRKFSNQDIYATIERVVIIPYDEVNKYIYLLEYRNCEDPGKALEIYGGVQFDVVILGKIRSDRTQFVCKELDTYLTENNIAFDYDDYIG